MKIASIILLLVGILLVLGRRTMKVFHKVRGREQRQFNELEEYMLISGVVLVILGAIFCLIL